MSYTVENATKGTAPDFSVDYEKVLLSQGSLMPAVDASESSAANVVTFTWSDNSGMGNAQATDLAMSLIYNEFRDEAVFVLEGATCAFYLAFASADGKLVSDSAFIIENSIS